MSNIPVAQLYKEWDENDRVIYWVKRLYGFRRQVAEYPGNAEDEVFTPKLLQSMRELDPDVDNIIPKIMTKLAQLEFVDADNMLSAFKKNCGLC